MSRSAWATRDLVTSNNKKAKNVMTVGIQEQAAEKDKWAWVSAACWKWSSASSA